MARNRREIIAELYGDDIVVFDDPAFDSAIIGVSHDNRAVYDYDKMVDGLAQEYMGQGENAEEAFTMATEWVEYNSIRALPYTPNSPIVVYGLGDEVRDVEEN